MKTERRGAARYSVVVPVQLQNSATGVTRDMSTCGLYFESEQAHSIGETIRLSMALNDSNVYCEGRVVRAERLKTKFGIAVELTSYNFESELEPTRHSSNKQKKSK